MNHIKSFCLGGLDEIGKVCCVVEINQKIFIFDCGIKQLIEVDLGVNYVIPDFNYLIKNREKIQGVFLSNASQELTGSLKFLIRKIPEINIYCTETTKVLISTKPNSNLEIVKKIISLQPKGNQFKEVKINYFQIAGNLPGNCGFIIHIGQERIVYTNNFLINNQSNNSLFTTNLRPLFKHHGTTILVIGNSQQTNYLHFARPKNNLNKWLEDALLNDSKQIYITCFENEWFKIYSTLKFLANEPDKYQITFFDCNFGNWYWKNLGKYHQNSNLIFNKNSNLIKNKKQIIFVTGNEKWLFNRIKLLINNKNHPLALNKDSYFFLLISKSAFLNEINVYNLLNRLYTTEAQIKFLNEKQITPMIGGLEDLKMLLKITDAKYFWPINGYHQDLKRAVEVIPELIDKANILVRENGEIIEWNKHLKINSEYQAIKLDTIFIENDGEQFIHKDSIQERKELGENGIILLSMYYEVKNKNIELCCDLQTKFIGVNTTETQKQKILNQIDNLLRIQLKKGNLHKQIQNKNFNKKIEKEIQLIFKKEIYKFPIINFNAIQKN